MKRNLNSFFSEVSSYIILSPVLYRMRWSMLRRLRRLLLLVEEKKPCTTWEALLPAVVKMAEIIHEKTTWCQTKKHFFASKYCWKVHGKHCWRCVETSIRKNDAVWEMCYIAGWKCICLTYLSLRYLLDSVSIMKSMKNYFFSEPLEERCVEENIFSKSITFLIKTMPYGKTVQV